ncbi:MAG TPA: Hsp70 family protein [Actinoplanes sp.]|nr:Hsp70 family protein [Actinoplanes sp.]
MSYALGVDLGTTYTAAAVRVDGRAQIVRLGSRRAEIPSLVFVREDGVVLVGDAAERRGPDDPARLARDFKRRLGDPVPVLVGGSPYSAHALMARVLQYVHQAVVRQQEAAPSVVCVTHPANWGPYKRELLQQATHMADVPNVQLRSEPEAAAVQYAAQERVQPGEVVAVYDLGGGTFDAAVLRKTDTGFEILGEPTGIEQLGGVDFDEAILAHVLAMLGPRVEGLSPEDPAVREALTQLRRSCVTAKEDLSDDTEVLVPVALPSLHTRVRLNRSEFEAMISPVLDSTIDAMHRALRSAGVSPDELHSILLAGGSSRIPLVGQLLATQFGRPLALDGDPAHAVALGAALTAGGTAPARRVPGRTRPETAPATPRQFVAGRATIGSPPTAEPVAMATVEDSSVDAGRPAVTTAAPPTAQTPGRPFPAQTPVGGQPPNVAQPSVTAQAPVVGRVPSLPLTPPPVVSPPPPVAGAELTPVAPARRAPLRIGAVVAIVALLLGGATAVLVMNRDRDPGSDAQPQTTATGSRTGFGSPLPTDPILIRVDTGPISPPGRRSNTYSIVPGSNERRQLSNGGTDVRAAWSHDRKRIAFVRLGGTNTLYVMDADGSNVTKVTDDLIYSRVMWSMDDSRLVFTRRVGVDNQIFTVKPGSKPVQLTWSTAPKNDPIWTPDGRHLLYWAKYDGVTQIFELDVESPREPGRVVVGPDAGPADDPYPSPDGKHVLYTRETGRGASDIWVVGMDGSNPRKVIDHPLRDMDPAWSRDGTWFAFVRVENNRPMIVVARPDGTGELTLTDSTARAAGPHWY